MSFLDTLTNKSPGTPQVTSSATQQNLPDWYTSLTRDLAGRGVQIAAQPYTPYEGARLAEFSPLQQTALAQADGYRPFLDQAQTALDNATGPGAAPTQWGAAPMQQYMSPYTSGVVDEIGRLGNRNFAENLMPSVNGAFTSAGQFGSSRNAEILGRTMRDAQADISGQQAKALESGYNTAGTLFGADQNRMLQYGQQQGNLANQAGALGQIQQGLNQGTFSLGSQQQQQQQRGLDLGYQDFQEQQGFDQAQLDKLKSALSGMQLPGGGSAVTSTPGAPGTSPLGWFQSILNQRAGG
jgi:hypothetical protein